MSAHRRVTAPPSLKAEVVTESLRPDSPRKTVDPFSEPPPGFGLETATFLTRRISSRAVISPSAPLLSGFPGTGNTLF